MVQHLLVEVVKPAYLCVFVCVLVYFLVFAFVSSCAPYHEDLTKPLPCPLTALQDEGQRTPVALDVIEY